MTQSIPIDATAGRDAVTDTILNALPEDQVLESNALATVTTNCLIVKSSDDHAQTIIPIVHLSSIRTAKTSYPGLLVVSAACLLISAAAYCSKQEGGAAVPSAVLGVLFLLAHLAYRRVAVSFITKSDETLTGTAAPAKRRH